MRRVFVSYSRHNLDAITQLIEDLQAVGIDTWYDQTLTGGQRWWDSILANIRECDIFIFALSTESWDSEACRSELDYVVQLGKPILPVLVSDGININLLSPPLNEIQVTDYRRRDKGAAFALVKSINTTPSNASLPDPLPPPPHVPVSYLSNLKERIDSPEPLSSQEQITLLFELEAGVREGRSPMEIHDLLLRLKRRDDLLAKVATKIDAALRSLEDKTPVEQRANAAPDGTLPAYAHMDSGGGNYRPTAEPRLCPQCHIQVKTGTRFCGACGAALGEPTAAPVPAPLMVPAPMEHVQKVERSKSRRYVCAAGDTPRLIADLRGWLDAQGFDCQQMNTESQSLLIQIKKRGGWRDFVGMATSLNILFHQSGDTLTVEIGAGKWIDKAAVGTVSLFILWPLAVTAGFGAWEQMKMPEKIFDYIGTRSIYK
jgi:TIR domain